MKILLVEDERGIAAVIRRGDLALGITTGGRCPMLARVLKDWLERLLPLDFAQAVEALSATRRRLKARSADNQPLEAAAIRATARFEIPDYRLSAPGRTPDRIEPATVNI